jgi:hypothetical protein
MLTPWKDVSGLGAYDKAGGPRSGATLGVECMAPRISTWRRRSIVGGAGGWGRLRGGARGLNAFAMRRGCSATSTPTLPSPLAAGAGLSGSGQNERADRFIAKRRHPAQVLGSEHRETAVSQSDLARPRLNGDLDGAETLLRQSLETNRRTRGDDREHRHDVARPALVAASRGDYGTAEAQLRRVLELQKKAMGEQHPVVAMVLNSLAHVLRAEGRDDEARPVLQEALAIAGAALGAGHQLVAIYSIDLAERFGEHARRRGEPLLRNGFIRAQAPASFPAGGRSEDDWRRQRQEPAR